MKYGPELAMVFVAFMYAMLSVAVRLMDVGMSANIAFATRSLVGALVGYVLFALVMRTVRTASYTKLTMRDWALFIFLGAVGYAGAIIMLSYSVLLTNLFTVAVILASVPLFVALIEFIAFGKRVTTLQSVLIVVSVIGIALCSLTPGAELDISAGALLALTSALLTALYVVGVARQKVLNSHELGVLLMGTASVTALAISFYMGYSITWGAVYSLPFIIGLVIGVTFNIGASTLEPWALPKLKSAAVGSQILLLEVAFSLALGFILYAEVPTLVQALGAVLIIGSVAANNFSGPGA